MLRKAVLLSSVFMLGILSDCLWRQYHQDSSQSPDHAPQIYQSLMLLSSQLIAPDKQHCEQPDPGRRMRVSDYLGSYLYWAQNPGANGKTSLSCEGGNPATCTLEFGEAKRVESWQRFLRFSYDAKTASVLPESIECLDVP